MKKRRGERNKTKKKGKIGARLMKFRGRAVDAETTDSEAEPAASDAAGRIFVFLFPFLFLLLLLLLLLSPLFFFYIFISLFPLQVNSSSVSLISVSFDVWVPREDWFVSLFVGFDCRVWSNTRRRNCLWIAIKLNWLSALWFNWSISYFWSIFSVFPRGRHLDCISR